MTTGCIIMATGSVWLGSLTYHIGTTAVKNNNSLRALHAIEETSPSLDGITDEKMIALLKTQGITMDMEELAQYREKYNALSDQERMKFLALYADTPLWPMLAGGAVGLLAFCVMGARWGFIN